MEWKSSEVPRVSNIQSQLERQWIMKKINEIFFKLRPIFYKKHKLFGIASTGGGVSSDFCKLLTGEDEIANTYASSTRKLFPLIESPNSSLS